MIIPEGILKKVFVHGVSIKKNALSKTKLPVIGVWTKDEVYEGFEVHIKGPSEVVYSLVPMESNAHVWVETTSELELIINYEGLKND